MIVRYAAVVCVVCGVCEHVRAWFLSLHSRSGTHVHWSIYFDFGREEAVGIQLV
eukprot:m.92823 g.92823  ORF g.92823 m.92823 type:complete len:54 (-) comp12370_c1_seq2:2197-2358(-)